MTNVIVDVQFFRTQDKILTPKELACYDGSRIAHYLFKPPFGMDKLQPHLQKQAEWLIEHHHSIQWDQGFVSAHLCGPILCHLVKAAETIYVKGKEKADFVRNITSRKVIELPEEAGVQRMQPACFYHSAEKCVCALSNVYSLYFSWMMN